MNENSIDALIAQMSKKTWSEKDEMSQRSFDVCCWFSGFEEGFAVAYAMFANK